VKNWFQSLPFKFDLCRYSVSLEERLAPDYKSATIFEQWVVQSVTGEPADLELPTAPERRHPPEAIVDAQLAALRAGGAEQFECALPIRLKAPGFNP
jgi:hypothetical protein